MFWQKLGMFVLLFTANAINWLSETQSVSWIAVLGVQGASVLCECKD